MKNKMRKDEHIIIFSHSFRSLKPLLAINWNSIYFI